MDDSKFDVRDRMNTRGARCPMCQYDLQGLIEDGVCPECGIKLDFDLVSCPEMVDTIAKTKTLCIWGGIGWCISAIAYWLAGMAYLSWSEFYFPGSVGSLDYVAVWLITSYVIAPLALNARWLKSSRRSQYRAVIEGKRPAPKFLIRIALVNVPAILLGFVLLFFTCCVGLNNVL